MATSRAATGIGVGCRSEGAATGAATGALAAARLRVGVLFRAARCTPAFLTDRASTPLDFAFSDRFRVPAAAGVARLIMFAR